MRRMSGVKWALATALSMAMPGSPIFAETFPSKPIKVISPYSGGGNSELFVRLVAEEVGRTIGQRVFVEPRPGAGGNLATEAVVRSAPDGYTILMAAPLLAINAALYTKLKIDPLKDLTPVTLGISAPYVMYATTTIAAKDAGDLIALAKARPGTINYGSLGIGSGPHLGGALFGMQAGIDIVHIPYRGFAQILPDLLRGTVHFTFNGVGVGGQLVDSGQLRVLGHTGSREVHGKIEGLKAMNPVSDILPGYELLGYYGFWAPRDTPAPVIQKLNQEFARAMKSEAISAKILQMGMMPEALSPEASHAFLAKDIEKWRAVVVAAGVKVED